MQQGAQRGHAVAGEHAQRVVDAVPRRLGRVIVHVQNVQVRSIKKPQRIELRSSLVDVKDVQEQARLWMAAFHGDTGHLSYPREHFGKSPELQLRDDAQ